MKRTFVKILLAVFACGAALNADPIQDVTGDMASSDSATRAASMDRFVRSLGTVTARRYAIPAIPVLVNALSDPDITVRQRAATGLLMVASAAAPVVFPSNPGAAELSANSVRQALLKATSDPDAQVRETAIEVYAVTYKLTPDLENKIIQEFNSPASEMPNRPSNRVAMLESLMIARSPSPSAAQFLTTLLDDPKYAPHVAERMAADKCPLPRPALDKLVRNLVQEKGPGARGAYARAIGIYGKEAKRYLPQLHTALAKEMDESAKSNLQKTVDKVQSGADG